MESPRFFDQVKKQFRFLIDDFQFSISEELSFPNVFGNCLVLMQSKDCRIRVVLERGQVFIDVSPLSTSAPDLSSSWFDLMVIAAFVAQGSPQERLAYAQPDDSLGPEARIDWQLSRLSGILRSNWENILDLFSQDTFEKKKQELADFRRKWAEERLKQHRK